MIGGARNGSSTHAGAAAAGATPPVLGRNALSGAATTQAWPSPSWRLPPPDWIADPDVVRVLEAFVAAGADARFVGGCVRDAVLRRPIADIDLATPETPEAVSRLLEAAGVKAVPTGIDHGTVTAVSEGRAIEVTTLRRDVETDGRRAVVVFTDDWREDAARRDFTVNALSMDREARLFDPFDGLEDLALGRVRFIGDADARIREDYLRILRFFRFHAHYGWIDGEMQALDPDGLAACAANVGGLATLSAERIWSELEKTLRAPEPASLIGAMAPIGALAAVLPEIPDGDRARARLASVVTLEGITTGSDPVRRLAAMLDLAAADGRGRAEAAAERLRLSGRDRSRLTEIAAAQERISPDLPDQAWRASLYALGLERFQDLALLSWAEELDGEKSVDRFETERWCALFRNAGDWRAPTFPLRGADLLALGVPPGPDMGETLRAVEAWWIAGDFAADEAACLREAERVATALRDGAGG